MMTTSSSFKNRVQEGNIYVGVPLAQDTTATKSTHTTRVALLAFLLGLIMENVGFFLIQLLNVMHFFLFGPTWTPSVFGLLLFVCLCVTVVFSLWFAFKCHFIDDDGGDDEDENLHKEDDILEAWCDLYVLGFIVGLLGSVVLENCHPNLVYNLFGLNKTDSSKVFDILTLIPVTLLWMFYTKMRVYHAAVNRANEAKRGSIDPLTFYIRV
jgi:hypothetical protein